jgi:hypothetical protein
MEQRAELALEELKRVGGFSRSVLVVATPTGTGWLDPGAVDTVEYLHAGDTAIVSMQYSHLPSWITILIDPQRSRHAARALFDEIYGHWRTLPRDSRPKLYLHGLSLGSLGSEASADLFTCSRIRSTAGSGAARRFRVRFGGASREPATPILRCGCPCIAMDRWCGSPARRTPWIEPANGGGRCGSSTSSTPAIRCASSRRICCTESPIG